MKVKNSADLVTNEGSDTHDFEKSVPIASKIVDVDNDDVDCQNGSGDEPVLENEQS